jgi:HK97 family phage major capsid protein
MDKIQELLTEIKGLSEAQIAEKMSEVKATLEKRDAELDKKMGTLDEQRNEFQTNLEKKMAEMVDSIKGAFPNMEPEKTESRFKNFGDFTKLVKSKDMSIKDLAEGAGNTGGYLVPEQFSNEILKINLENSVVRNNGARVLTLNSPTFRIPALDMSSNASGSLYGGASAYWGKENTSITESQPTFDDVKLEVAKLTAYVEDSNEMEADAITNMSSLLTSMYGEVLAFEEDYAFLNGDGVNKPLGILNAPALITVSRSTASQVHPADIVGMIARFRGSLDRAVFVVNQSVLPQIFQLADPNGNYIWHPGMSGSIAGKAMGTIYGIPFIVTEKAPALGTTGDFGLYDFGHYLIGDLGGLRTDYSQHYKFQTDQMAYRCIKRVDGQPWLKSAITPRNGGSTLSPFVALA